MPPATSILWLVVEDDENDFILLQRACGRVQPQPRLLRLQNGMQAREYLARFSQPVDVHIADRPALILSDIKMPQLDGFQLLEWIRTQPELRAVPFIFISSSNLQIDRDRAHALQADGYLVKPPAFPILVQILQDLTAGHPPAEPGS